MWGTGALGARPLLRVAVIAMILTVPMMSIGQAAASGTRARVAVAMTRAAAPGVLTIKAVPANVSLANAAIVVQVANVGRGCVRSVRIEVDTPPGVRAVVKPLTISRLVAGTSMLVTITVLGSQGNSPAALVIRAIGRSDAGKATAVTSVYLAPPEPDALLSLVGNTRLTDVSPADLIAVVDNLADVPVNVSVRATAGQQVVRLAREGKDVTRAAPGAPLAMVVPARQSAVVLVQVTAHLPLRPGTVGLVVIAAVRPYRGVESSDTTASRQLNVTLAADVLPGLTGIGSVLVIPGLVAIWVILSVWYLDRRRLGLAVRSVGSQIWDNKLWFFAAGVLSLLAAVVYSAAGFADLLIAYTLRDIVIVTVVTGLLGALFSAVVVWLYRRKVPAITPTSTELSVLQAANRKDNPELSRIVYRTPDGRRGLLVHKDWGAIVLTPPVEYSGVDDMENLDSLQDAIEKIEKAIRRTDGTAGKMRFLQSGGNNDNDYVEGPCAVSEATPSGREEILRYKEF